MNELRGLKVIEEISEKLKEEISSMSIIPTLAILGVGENPSDVSYKKGILKRANELGVKVCEVILPIDISQSDFDIELEKLNMDNNIHGILMFRPLPSQLNEEKARNMIKPEKDMDGCGDLSLAGVFTGQKIGYPPCTAEACIKILDSYGIDVSGKNVCVIGRSLVIGKPVSLMLLNRNATVTMCHSRTNNIKEIAKNADILVSCIGKLEYITREYVNENQIILDVGINWDGSKNRIAGDVKYDEVSNIVSAITPVPGGIGGITSAILMEHVVNAAKNIKIQ